MPLFLNTMKSSSEFELFESRHVVLLDFAFNEPVGHTNLQRRANTCCQPQEGRMISKGKEVVFIAQVILGGCGAFNGTCKMIINPAQASSIFLHPLDLLLISPMAVLFLPFCGFRVQNWTQLFPNPVFLEHNNLIGH